MSAKHGYTYNLVNSMRFHFKCTVVMRYLLVVDKQRPLLSAYDIGCAGFQQFWFFGGG